MEEAVVCKIEKRRCEIGRVLQYQEKQTKIIKTQFSTAQLCLGIHLYRLPSRKLLFVLDSPVEVSFPDVLSKDDEEPTDETEEESWPGLCSFIFSSMSMFMFCYCSFFERRQFANKIILFV